MKKFYKAMATLTDGIKEWDVCIYSHYNSQSEAVEGIKRFISKGYNIVLVWVE